VVRTAGTAQRAAGLTSRAERWAYTDLRGYPTLRAEEETEETLAAEPKAEQVKKGKPRREDQQ
jgi:hypothetical protein